MEVRIWATKTYLFMSSGERKHSFINSRTATKSSGISLRPGLAIASASVVAKPWLCSRQGRLKITQPSSDCSKEILHLHDVAKEPLSLMSPRAGFGDLCRAQTMSRFSPHREVATLLLVLFTDQAPPIVFLFLQHQEISSNASSNVAHGPEGNPPGRFSSLFSNISACARFFLSHVQICPERLVAV